MSDLISREAALEVLDEINAEVEDGYGFDYPKWRVHFRVLPSAQPEIIRCKDCRYWQDNNGGYPHDECRWNKDETPDEDDFCSYAERLERKEIR